MHDAHVHLDFMENGEQVAAEAHAAGALLFLNSVTPDGFISARERFGGYENVAVGLGLHPWWIGDRDSMNAESPVEVLVDLLDETRFIGEIGLDFGRRHAETREAQVAAFSQIVGSCAERGGKILSVHSVHAAREAIDIIESSGVLASCTVVFHWFTGPSDQLKRAIDLGCLFSVGPRMLATGKGREYAKAIPARSLLFETDAPPEQGQRYSFSELRSLLVRVRDGVAGIKGADVLEEIERHADALFS